MDKITVKIEKLQHAQDLSLPAYATEHSAGVDLLAAVKDNIILAPGEIKLIPTGLKIALPTGYEAQIRPRSGLALKNGLVIPNSPGTIDADYRGEVQIILMNLGKQNFEITRGMRIAQMVFAKYIQGHFIEDVISENTERGTGGFGSTGIAG